MLLGIFEFGENRRIEDHTPLMDINEILSRMHPETMWQYESKERLGKIYIQRQWCIPLAVFLNISPHGTYINH